MAPTIAPTVFPTESPTASPTYGPASDRVVSIIMTTTLIGVILLAIVYWIVGHYTYMDDLASRIRKDKDRDS